MVIDPVTVVFARHELLAVQHLVAKAVLKQGASAALEMADDRIAGALIKADADKQSKIEFTAFWEANQHLQMGEARALFAGKKLAFYADSRLPLRRGEIVRMRTGFVLGGEHVSLHFAYTTDDGQIATQEPGEPVLVWDADDLVDVKMVGRPDSHVDRHQTA